MKTISRFKEQIEDGKIIIDLIDVDFADHLNDCFENVIIKDIEWIDSEDKIIDDELVLIDKYKVSFKCDFLITVKGDQGLKLINHDCFEYIHLVLTESEYNKTHKK